ncbi:MAG TPA: polyphosphate kinase 2 family protein [Pirellulaceae bacterium]|nr:polyphosphate kinase 2 family protein [Pirellulaceae bacterium]
MSNEHQMTPGKKFRLEAIPTKASSFHDDRQAAEEEFLKLRDELAEVQRKLYAEGKHKLLIVLQAMDAGGKDGTIRHVFGGVNPQGVRVTSFKQPSEIEISHDYLWRIHQAVPATGMIAVFNRSHYEDVLVVRVENLVPKKSWGARFEQINQFERMLTETGTTILKFYLHISKGEQAQRLQARLDDPEKNWKFSTDDLEKRKRWDEYMVAYEDALNRCTTDWAPWYVIPADQKWYRNLAIARIVVNALRELKPQFPTTTIDPDMIRFE